MQVLLVDKDVLIDAQLRYVKKDERLPRCKLVARFHTHWVVVDNSTGQCWTESFVTLHETVAWLNGYWLDD